MIKDTPENCSIKSTPVGRFGRGRMTMTRFDRVRAWLSLMGILLFVSLVSTPAKAESVVFAVDAALPRVEIDQAETMILALQDRLSPSVDTALVVFDDVVQKVVSLGVNDEARRVEVIEALGSIGRKDTSSIASGVERSFEMLKEIGSGNILMFGRGIIDSESEEGRSRHKDWLDLVLLPDARDANISVNLFTPGTGEDETILSSVLGQPLNSHTLMQMDAKLPTALTALVPGIATVEDLMGEFVVASVDPVESEPAGDVSVVAAPETTTTVSQEESPTDSGAGLISGLQGEQWLKILWAVALLSIAVLLLFLLYWMVKGRRSKQRSSDNTVTGTSSTYLPLDAEPTTGGFSALASRIDKDETQEDWTLPTVANEHDEFLARTLPAVDGQQSQSDVMSFEPSSTSTAAHEEKTVLRNDQPMPTGSQEISDQSGAANYPVTDQGSDVAASSVTGASDWDADEKTRLRPNQSDSVSSPVVADPGSPSTAFSESGVNDFTDEFADGFPDDIPSTDDAGAALLPAAEGGAIEDEDRTVLRPRPSQSADSPSSAELPGEDPNDDLTVPRPSVRSESSDDK